MALIKLTEQERKSVRKRLLKWYNITTSSGKMITSTEAHRMLFSTLSELGIADVNIPVGRAEAPSYETLGMTRNAGPPTKEEIARYKEVTGGGILDENGFVAQILLFDNDLIRDRSAVMSFKGLSDLYTKYLGRANDFNHSFRVQDARCRIIDLGLGYDPSSNLHPNRPTDKMMSILPGGNAYDGVYTALWGTVAFPFIAGDDTISKIKSGLIKDESVCFSTTPGTDLCSECMTPLTHSFCFTECDEHGFTGGRTEEGNLISCVMTGVDDALTFGLVSDGAVTRAGIQLMPNKTEAQAIEKATALLHRHANSQAFTTEHLTWDNTKLAMPVGSQTITS
jgi:hypothetical protein